MAMIWLVLAAGLGFVACSNPPSPTAESAVVVTERHEGALEQLSPQGERGLRNIVDSGKLDGLRWPNFADHKFSVKGFYEETGYKLAWSRNGEPTSQALELIRILEDAESKGLNSEDYDGARWSRRLAVLQSNHGTPESTEIAFDVALTVSSVRYVSDLHLGKVDPKNLHKDFDVERQHHDPGAFLRINVVGAKNVQDVLTRVECPYPGYLRDLVALQKYREMEKQKAPDPLPPVRKPIEPGQSYEGVGQLVRSLQFLGDLPASVTLPKDSRIYSNEMAEGVRLFQSHHGIESNGKLGPKTITEINQPIRHRVEQLRLSLERWRWLPHEYAEPPIVVNIPEFKLRTGDSPEKGGVTMSVVVGKAMRTETPVLEEDMKYVVFWPYWNVPPSILRGEIIPKIAKNREYLQRNDYEAVTFSGQVVTDSLVSDDVLASLRAGKLMVRQKPGPRNALGLVKFIFPNDSNVYLHSTPDQSLFSRSQRDFSHGCIRVEDPKALAGWVLRNNPGWTKKRIAEAFAAGKEQQVNLIRTIPVLIIYVTAVAEEDGQVFFFSDIYGHDKSLADLEAQAYGSHN